MAGHTTTAAHDNNDRLHTLLALGSALVAASMDGDDRDDFSGARGLSGFDDGEPRSDMMPSDLPSSTVTVIVPVDG